ncbi:MAG: 5-formyltetrahydrofolate cyclo-ligase [Candidatus Peregrinibacteria bacterium Gr01-1014_25]|nr:MAG: 5-formyltetrahydrofolate cyclo-ligase [Candidatus Peregrinibacteria bacterium Gr01-1014_25]
MDPRAEKQRLQDAVRERLARLNVGDRARESRSVCRRLLDALPAESAAICAFIPIKDEVDLRPFLTAVLERGIRLYLPCFEKTLVFRRAADLQLLAPGAFRIPEPPASADLLDPGQLDVAVVPGRAFDNAGNRLGRGNGGYDRWIRAQRAANPQTRFWGVCYECQVVSHVPMEAHDERVDAIVTARGFTSAAAPPTLTPH